MSDKYILDGTKTRLEPDLMKWAKWFETANRTIASSQIGDTVVSTVFLGLDHSLDNGPPILFETMTFGPGDEVCERCSSWPEAEQQHARICAAMTTTNMTAKPAAKAPSAASKAT